MAIFRGMSRTDYADLLRSVGRYLDQNGFSRIRILETEEGLVVQGIVSTEVRGEKHLESYLLTAQDLQDMVRGDLTRRIP